MSVVNESNNPPGIEYRILRVTDRTIVVVLSLMSFFLLLCCLVDGWFRDCLTFGGGGFVCLCV